MCLISISNYVSTVLILYCIYKKDFLYVIYLCIMQKSKVFFRVLFKILTQYYFHEKKEMLLSFDLRDFSSFLVFLTVPRYMN